MTPLLVVTAGDAVRSGVRQLVVFVAGYGVHLPYPSVGVGNVACGAVIKLVLDWAR